MASKEGGTLSSGEDNKISAENDDFEILDLEQEPQRRTPSMTELDRSRDSLSGSTEKALHKDSVSDSSQIKTYQETDIDEAPFPDEPGTVGSVIADEGKAPMESSKKGVTFADEKEEDMSQSTAAADENKNAAEENPDFSPKIDPDFSPITTTVQRFQCISPPNNPAASELAQDMDFVVIEPESSNSEETAASSSPGSLESSSESFVQVANELSLNKTGEFKDNNQVDSAVQKDTISSPGIVADPGQAAKESDNLENEIEHDENVEIESESGNFQDWSDDSASNTSTDGSDSGDYDTMEEPGPDSTSASAKQPQLKHMLSVVPEEDIVETGNAPEVDKGQVPKNQGHANTDHDLYKVDEGQIGGRFSLNEGGMNFPTKAAEEDVELDDYRVVMTSNLEFGSDSEIYATDSTDSGSADTAKQVEINKPKVNPDQTKNAETLAEHKAQVEKMPLEGPISKTQPFQLPVIKTIRVKPKIPGALIAPTETRSTGSKVEDISMEKLSEESVNVSEPKESLKSEAHDESEDKYANVPNTKPIKKEDPDININVIDNCIKTHDHLIDSSCSDTPSTAENHGTSLEKAEALDGVQLIIKETECPEAPSISVESPNTDVSDSNRLAVEPKEGVIYIERENIDGMDRQALESVEGLDQKVGSEDGLIDRATEEVDALSERSYSTADWDDALSEKSTEEILSEAVDTLKGGQESRFEVSRGRRRKKKDRDGSDAENRRARSGSAKRHYDWNSSHFFPDIHGPGEFEGLSPLPKTPEKRRSRYNDFIEEEWVRDQIRDQLEIELRKQQEELNKQLKEQQQSRLDDIQKSQGQDQKGQSQGDISVTQLSSSSSNRSQMQQHVSSKLSGSVEQHDISNEIMKREASPTYKSQTYSQQPRDPQRLNDECVTMATKEHSNGRRMQNILTQDGSRTTLEKTQLSTVDMKNRDAEMRKNAQSQEKSENQRAVSDKSRPFGPDIIHPSAAGENADEQESLSSDPEDGPKTWTKSPLRVNRRKRRDRPSSQELRLDTNAASTTREPPSSPTRTGIKMGSPRVQMQPQRQPAFSRSPHRQSAPQMGTKSVKKMAANPGASSSSTKNGGSRDDMQVKYEKFNELQRRRAALESNNGSDEQLNTIQKQSVQDSLRRYQKHTRQHGALLQHKTEKSPANRQLFKEKSEEKEIFITGPAVDQSQGATGKANDEYANDFLMQMKKRLKSVNKSQEDITREETTNKDDQGHEIIVERSQHALLSKSPLQISNENKQRKEPKTRPGVIKPIDSFSNTRVTNISQSRKYIQSSQTHKPKQNTSESKQWEEQVEIFPFTESVPKQQRTLSSTSEIRSTTDTPTSQISERSGSSRRNLDARSLILEEKKKFEEYKRDFVRRQSSKESSGEELESSSECRSPTQKREIPPDEYEYVLRKIHPTSRQGVVPSDQAIGASSTGRQRTKSEGAHRRADEMSPRGDGRDQIPEFMMEPQNKGKYLDKKKYFQGQYEGSYWLDSETYLQKQQEKLKQRHSSGDFDDKLSPRATGGYPDSVFHDNPNVVNYPNLTGDPSRGREQLPGNLNISGHVQARDSPREHNRQYRDGHMQREHVQPKQEPNLNQGYPHINQNDVYRQSQPDSRSTRDHRSDHHGNKKSRNQPKQKEHRDDMAHIPYEQYDYENQRGVNNVRMHADFDHTPPAKVDANPEIFPRFQPRYGSLPRDHGSRASAFEQYSRPDPNTRQYTHHSVSPNRSAYQPSQYPQHPEASIATDPGRGRQGSGPYQSNDYRGRKAPPKPLRSALKSRSLTHIDHDESDVCREQFDYHPERVQETAKGSIPPTPYTRMDYSPQYRVAPDNISPRDARNDNKQPHHIYNSAYQPESPNQRPHDQHHRHPDIIPYGNTYQSGGGPQTDTNLDDLPPPPPELLEPHYSTLDPYQNRDRSPRDHGNRRDQNSPYFDPEWAYARRQQQVAQPAEGMRQDPSDFDRYTWSAPPVMHPSQDPYHQNRNPYDMYRMDDRPTHSPYHTQPAPTDSTYSPVSRTRLQQPPEQPLSAYQPLRDRSPYQFDDRAEYGPDQPRTAQTGPQNHHQPRGDNNYQMSAKERDRYVREYVPNTSKGGEYGPNSSSNRELGDYGDAAPRHKPSSLKRKKGVNDPQGQKRYSQPIEGAYDGGINRYSAPLDVTGAGHSSRSLDGNYGAGVGSESRPLDVSYSSAAGDRSRGPFDISFNSTWDDPSRRPMGDQPYGSTGDQSRPLDYSSGTFATDVDPALSTKTQRSHGGGHGSIPIYRTDSQEREERSHPRTSLGRSKSAENRSSTQGGPSKKTYTQIFPPPPDATVFEFTPAEQKVFVKQLENKLIDLKKSDPKRYSSYEEKVNQYMQEHKQSLAAASYEEHIARSRSQFRSQHESDLTSAAERHQREERQVQMGERRDQRDDRQYPRDDAQRRQDKNQDYVELNVIRQRKGESRSERKEQMKRSKSLPREQERNEPSTFIYSAQSSGFARQAKTTQSFRQSPERRLQKEKSIDSDKAILRPARSAENLINTKDDIPVGSVSTIKERLFGPGGTDRGAIPITMLPDPSQRATPDSKRIKSDVLNKTDAKPVAAETATHLRSSSFLSEDKYKDERIREYASYRDGKVKKRSQILDDLTDLEYTYDRLNLDDDNLMSGAANHDFNIPAHADGADSFEPNVKRLSITNVKKFEDMLQRHIDSSETPSLDYAKEWLRYDRDSVTGSDKSTAKTDPKPEQERPIHSSLIQDAPVVRSYMNRPESSLPRKKTDDMAYRKIHPYPESTRSNTTANPGYGSSPKTTPAPSEDASNKISMQRRAFLNQPCPVYDDMVNRAMRRSRSPEKKDPTKVVLPSATSTDYLKDRHTEPERGRLRGKPQANFDKYHEDMAYRRLRRDVSPVKIEIKSSSSYYNNKIANQSNTHGSLKTRSKSLDRVSAQKQQQQQQRASIPIRRSNSFEREPPRDLPRLPPKSLDKGVAKMVRHFSANKELSQSAPNLNEVFAPQYNTYGDLISQQPEEPNKELTKPISTQKVPTKKKETPRIVKQRSEFKSKSKTKSGDSGFYPESGESDSPSCSGTDNNLDQHTDGAYESDDIDKKRSPHKSNKHGGLLKQNQHMNYNNNNRIEIASSTSSPFPSARSDDSKLESELATELSHFNSQLSKLDFIDSTAAANKQPQKKDQTDASRPSHIDLSTVRLKPVSNVIMRHSPSPQGDKPSEPRKSPFQLKREMLRHVQSPDGVEEEDKVEVKLSKPKAFAGAAFKSEATASLSHTLASHTPKETVYTGNIGVTDAKSESVDNSEQPKETIYSTGFEAPKPKKEMDDFDKRLQEAKIKLTTELSPRLRRTQPGSIVPLRQSEGRNNKEGIQNRPLSVDASLIKLKTANQDHQEHRPLKFNIKMDASSSHGFHKKQYPKSPWPYEKGLQGVDLLSDQSVDNPFKEMSTGSNMGDSRGNFHSDVTRSPGNFHSSESRTSVTKTPTGGECKTSHLQQQSFEQTKSENQDGRSVTETREREVHVIRRSQKEVISLPVQTKIATVQPRRQQQIMDQSQSPNQESKQTPRDLFFSQSQPLTVPSHARQWSRELSDGELTDATDITIDSLVRANQPIQLPIKMGTSSSNRVESDADSTVSGDSQEATSNTANTGDTQAINQAVSKSDAMTSQSQVPTETYVGSETSSSFHSRLETSYQDVDTSGVVLRRKKEMSKYKREVKKEIKEERRLSLKDRVQLFEDQASPYMRGPRINDD